MILTDEAKKDNQRIEKRGMTFVGATIVYSYLQAISVINGHSKECFCWQIRTGVISNIGWSGKALTERINRLLICK